MLSRAEKNHSSKCLHLQGHPVKSKTAVLEMKASSSHAPMGGPCGVHSGVPHTALNNYPMCQLPSLLPKPGQTWGRLTSACLPNSPDQPSKSLPRWAGPLAGRNRRVPCPRLCSLAFQGTMDGTGKLGSLQSAAQHSTR